MAETKVKPYTFLNSSIVGKGNEPDTQSAKRVVLSFNRLGSTLVSIGKIQEQKLSLIKARNIWANQRKNILTKLQEKQAIKTKAFSESLKSLRAAKDKESEKKQESMDVPDANKVSGEVKKEAEDKLKWLKDLFKPFEAISAFIFRFFIARGILEWISNGNNATKIVETFKKLYGIAKFLFGVAYWSIDKFMSGLSSIFGDGKKQGFARFTEVLGGLGSLLLGIAGLKAFGYLLNPFKLVVDLMKIKDIVDSFTGGGSEPVLPDTPDPKAKPDTPDPKAKPEAPKPKPKSKKPGFLSAIGDKFSNFKKGIGEGASSIWNKFKGWGNNVTKGTRDKLANFKGWAGEQMQKKLQQISKTAYDVLESKGIVSTAKKLGNKTKDLVTKIPGFDKVAKKVASKGANLGAKAIPVIGGLVNLYFAFDRLKNGDRSGAFLEALSAILDLSGLFGFVPGPIISAVLDGYLFGRDFFPDVVKKENEIFGGMINAMLAPLKGIKDMLPKVPMLAEGGIVTKETQVTLGDGGEPEIVVPLSKLNSNGGTKSIASTIIAASLSSLERMGAAGELAKKVIQGDINDAKKEFEIDRLPSSGGGDSIGKAIQKKKISLSGSTSDNSNKIIESLLGDSNVKIDAKNIKANKGTNLREGLANLLGAMISISKKDLSSGGDSSGGGGGGGGGDNPPGNIDLKGNTNAEKVFRHLVDKEGFTPAAAAGVIGNLMQESGVNPKSRQLNGGPGRGIMQWTESERWASMKKWAGTKDPWALETQVQWMVKEMKDYGTYNRIKSVKDYKKAVEIFESEMERAGTPNYPRRYQFAASAYSTYGGTQKAATGGAVREWNKKHTPKGQTILTTTPKMQAKQPTESWKKFAKGGSFKNGQLPESELQSIGSGHKLHKSVAPQFKALQEAAKRDGNPFGSALKINSSYRSYQRQKELYNSLGAGTAAYPGTSNHGLGLAVDLWYTDKAYKWLRKNAGKFGFRQIPGYATDNPNGHEAWHWENVSGKGSIDGGTPTDSPGDSPSSPSSGGGSSEPELTPQQQLEAALGSLSSAISGVNKSLYGETPAAAPSPTGGVQPAAPSTPPISPPTSPSSSMASMSSTQAVQSATTYNTPTTVAVAVPVATGSSAPASAPSHPVYIAAPVSRI